MSQLHMLSCKYSIQVIFNPTMAHPVRGALQETAILRHSFLRMPRRYAELRQQRPALNLGNESLIDTDYDDETIGELDVEGATKPRGTISDGFSEIIGFSAIDIASSILPFIDGCGALIRH